MQMALRYGQDAPAHVLEGWQRQAGRSAIEVPCSDAGGALELADRYSRRVAPGVRRRP